MARNSWLGMALIMASLFAGCSRNDPAASPAVSADAQQKLAVLEGRFAQLATQLKDQESRPATTAGPSYRDFTELAAKVAALEAKAVKDADFQAVRGALETAQREVAQLRADAARLQTKLDEAVATLVQRDTTRDTDIETLKSANEERKANDLKFRASLQTLDEQINKTYRDLLDRIGQVTAPMSSPAVQTEIKRLQDALQKATDENSQLRQRAQASDDEVKRLKKRANDQDLEIARLREELDHARNAGRPNIPGASPETPGRQATAQGAYTGKILSVKIEAGYPSLVAFPSGTPFIERGKYNVFDATGKKIADFEVLTQSTPDSIRGKEVWFGGSMKLIKRDEIPKVGDRVSNLAVVPDLTDNKPD